MARAAANRNALRQPYVPKLVVFQGTVCYACAHARSSHSKLVLQARCRVPECTCIAFDPICGCGHLLCEHTWGQPPHPWSCALCACAHFGADMTGTVPHKSPLAPTVPPVAPKPAPKPVSAEHIIKTPDGTVCRWGRRELAMYDCYRKNCPDLASYWGTRAYYGMTGKLTIIKVMACGPHFREWWYRYNPPQQLSLFSAEESPV